MRPRLSIRATWRGLTRWGISFWSPRRGRRMARPIRRLPARGDSHETLESFRGFSCNQNWHGIRLNEYTEDERTGRKGSATRSTAMKRLICGTFAVGLVLVIALLAATAAPAYAQRGGGGGGHGGGMGGGMSSGGSWGGGGSWHGGGGGSWGGGGW